MTTIIWLISSLKSDLSVSMLGTLIRTIELLKWVDIAFGWDACDSSLAEPNVKPSKVKHDFRSSVGSSDVVPHTIALSSTGCVQRDLVAGIGGRRDWNWNKKPFNLATWKGFLSPPIKNISLAMFRIHAPKELTRSFRLIYLSLDTFGSNIISSRRESGPLGVHDNRDG